MRSCKQGENGRRVKVRDLSKDRQRNFAIVAEQVGLTTKEEHILRMRKGVGAPPEQELEFRGQDIEFTRRRLAKMERAILKRGACPSPIHPGLN